jgi:predicted dehydrogenase
MPAAVLRIGTLGAARITPPALLQPAARCPRAEVVAVAARDLGRARKFAEQHGIPAIGESYAALIERDDVDAVYNPLPAGLHAEWTLRALDAGKHVLCEKPFASNATEAQAMVQRAAETGRVLMEAFHYRYHPLIRRLLEVLGSGTIGRLRRIEGHFSVPIDDTNDIRYQLALGGGALMDLGCYPVHWVRTCAKAEPEVVGAECLAGPPGVDVSMTSELRFPNDVSARVDCSMAPGVDLQALLRIEGSEGTLAVFNPLAPHLGHSLRVRSSEAEFEEQVEGETTYDHQLDAFVAAVLDGSPLLTGGEDAIANMRVIDAIYTAAGLPLRGNGEEK